MIRSATTKDIQAFYGSVPGTMRATVAVLEGEVVGVVGVVRDPVAGKYFSDISDKLRPYLRTMTVMRAIKDSLRYVREYRGPVVAVTDDTEGQRLVTRLGFKHMSGGEFLWHK